MLRSEPFQLVPIDGVFPPAWEPIFGGTHPDPDGEVVDTTTRLRPTTGGDAVNYLTRQRVEGDLFNRDLVLHLSLKRLSDYLAARHGLTFSCPSIGFPADTEIAFGSLSPTDEILGYWVTGFSIHISTLSGYDLSDIEMVIENALNGDVLFSATALSRRTQVWTVSQNLVKGFRGPFLTQPLRFKLKNSSGVRVIMSGSIILSPRMNLEDDDVVDTDPGLLLLDDSVSALWLDDGVSRLILD